ncbi:MAG: hypothetical protein ABSE43_15890 [Steroidobacteraceae bacterium]
MNEGIVLALDSRAHAGVDNFATFCKMTVFERAGGRVIVLLSSGNLAGTQAVINVLKQRADLQQEDAASIWTARTMFDVAVVVSDTLRDVERRDGPYLAKGASPFNACCAVAVPLSVPAGGRWAQPVETQVAGSAGVNAAIDILCSWFTDPSVAVAIHRTYYLY